MNKKRVVTECLFFIFIVVFICFFMLFYQTVDKQILYQKTDKIKQGTEKIANETSDLFKQYFDKTFLLANELESKNIKNESELKTAIKSFKASDNQENSLILLGTEEGELYGVTGGQNDLLDLTSSPNLQIKSLGSIGETQKFYFFSKKFTEPIQLENQKKYIHFIYGLYF